MTGRAADVEAEVTFLSPAAGGRSKPASSGYRPNHLVTDGYLTSGQHEYIDVSEVQPGQTARARITFLTPEAYPRSLWVGKVVPVQEGGRVVGSARITAIFNDLLRR